MSAGRGPRLRLVPIALVAVAACGSDAEDHAAGTTQFGTGRIDETRGVTVVADGRVVVAGGTNGDLASPNVGDGDAFVRMLADDGEPAWTKQFGTNRADEILAVAAGNGAAGIIAVAGVTYGKLDAANPASSSSVFVRTYSADGSELWIRSFGTDGGDVGQGVAVAGDGSVVVVGYASGDLGDWSSGGFDAFVREFAPNGTDGWTRQIGTVDDDVAHAVAVGVDGSIVVTGATRGALASAGSGGDDVFVRRYTAAGDIAWTRQFGTGADDTGFAIAVRDDGSIAVAGTTGGALVGTSAGQNDAFVRVYAADGTELWTGQFGTAAHENGRGIVARADGTVSVVGVTGGDLAGASAGDNDAFVRTYALDGSVVSTQQFGNDVHDDARAVAATSDGTLVVAGVTNGDLGAENAGGSDVFVFTHDPADD